MFAKNIFILRFTNISGIIHKVKIWNYKHISGISFFKKKVKIAP